MFEPDSKRLSSSFLKEDRLRKRVRVYDCRFEGRGSRDVWLETTGLDYNDFLQRLQQAILISSPRLPSVWRSRLCMTRVPFIGTLCWTCHKCLAWYWHSLSQQVTLTEKCSRGSVICRSNTSVLRPKQWFKCVVAAGGWRAASTNVAPHHDTFQQKTVLHLFLKKSFEPLVNVPVCQCVLQ